MWNAKAAATGCAEQLSTTERFSPSTLAATEPPDGRVNSQSRLAHSAVVTSASIHDKHPLPDLLHGAERRVYEDSADTSQKELIGSKAPDAKDCTNQRIKHIGIVDNVARAKDRNLIRPDRRILGHAVVHVDETPVALLAPGRGKTKKAFVWVYRTTNFVAQRAVLFDFCASRAGEHPGRILKDFSGTLVTDDFSGCH